jgi:anti-sigma factor RsiW
MNCREVEDQLAGYVDGESSNAAAIAAHLETCVDCRASVQAQAVARRVLRARASELAPMAPPGLRTRLIALTEDSSPDVLRPARPRDLAWTGRLAAFAAAAMVVLTLGAILFPFATVRSTAVLAAQLALDHLKCFTIEGDAGAGSITAVQAEATLKREFDLTVTVPPSLEAERLELMAVRRCLYGDGRAAHLLYRLDGQPASLFIIPGLVRPPAEFSLFGHDEVVWTAGDRTYMLIARAGSRNGLARVASYLQNEAK